MLNTLLRQELLRKDQYPSLTARSRDLTVGVTTRKSRERDCDDQQLPADVLVSMLGARMAGYAGIDYETVTGYAGIDRARESLRDGV